jgi:hypothetical protein
MEEEGGGEEDEGNEKKKNKKIPSPREPRHTFSMHIAKERGKTYS